MHSAAHYKHAAILLDVKVGTAAAQPRSAPPQLNLQNANNALQQQQQQQHQQQQQQQLQPQQQQQIAPGMPVPAANPFAQMKLPPTLMACLVSNAALRSVHFWCCPLCNAYILHIQHYCQLQRMTCAICWQRLNDHVVYHSSTGCVVCIPQYTGYHSCEAGVIRSRHS
jgi:exonuclease V gamma subunit